MTNERILLVDDDQNLLESIARRLAPRYSLELAHSAAVGLQKLRAGYDFGVVVADYRMPETDGIEFLTQVRERSPNTIRVMLTGYADLPTAIKAVNRANIFRFLVKPCSSEEISNALDDSLEFYRLKLAERELREKTLRGAVELLTDVIRLTDPVAMVHTPVIIKFVRKLAAALDLVEVLDIELAAMLSHIGSVIVPAPVLIRARTTQHLSDSERRLLEQVPEKSAELLSKIPRLGSICEIIRYQGKRFDGGGLPEDGLRGEDIPLGSRILRLVHDFVDLRMGGDGKTEAIHTLSERTGCYDPKLLNLFARVCEVEMKRPVEAPSPFQEVGVDQLQPSHVTANDVCTKDGTILVPARTPLTEVLIERIANYAAFVGLDGPIRVYST